MEWKSIKPRFKCFKTTRLYLYALISNIKIHLIAILTQLLVVSCGFLQIKWVHVLIGDACFDFLHFLPALLRSVSRLKLLSMADIQLKLNEIELRIEWNNDLAVYGHKIDFFFNSNCKVVLLIYVIVAELISLFRYFGAFENFPWN